MCYQYAIFDQLCYGAIFLGTLWGHFEVHYEDIFGVYYGVHYAAILELLDYVGLRISKRQVVDGFQHLGLGLAMPQQRCHMELGNSLGWSALLWCRHNFLFGGCRQAMRIICEKGKHARPAARYGRFARQVGRHRAGLDKQSYDGC